MSMVWVGQKETYPRMVSTPTSRHTRLKERRTLFFVNTIQVLQERKFISYNFVFLLEKSGKNNDQIAKDRRIKNEEEILKGLQTIRGIRRNVLSRSG